MLRVVALVGLAGCLVGDGADEATDPDLDGGHGGPPHITDARGDKSVRLDPGATDTAELVKFLPIATDEGKAKKQVVMHVRAPQLAAGDRVMGLSEAQVTTRCDIGQTAPGCDYDPHVKAKVILGNSANDTDGPIVGSIEQTCTRNAHHCMFVFVPANATATVDRMACMPNDCHVNLVMWAWHDKARANGDVMLVGGNDGDFLADGKPPEQDVGRLMVVRERGIVAADRDRAEKSGGGSTTIPTTATSKRIYSIALNGGKDLVAGEQYIVEARLPVDVGGRARISSQLSLSNNDNIAPGAIDEHNGFNCAPSFSPCVLKKVAVFRVQAAMKGPVEVHYDLESAVPGGGSTHVEAKGNDGEIRVTRYAANLGT